MSLTLAAAGTTSATTYLADAGSGGSADPLSLLTGLGPVGVILILFILGKLRTEAEVRSLETRLAVKDQIINQKDEQIIALMNGYTDKAMPTLSRAISALERLESERGRGSP